MSLSANFTSVSRDRWMFLGGPGVLTYHKIARAPLTTNLAGLYVDPSSFRRQIRALAESGLKCLAFGDVSAAARQRAPGFCLTFDDGFRNVFANALPVLQKYRLRAIQFLVAGCIGGEDVWDQAAGEPLQALMNDEEIKAWLAAGHEIGAHTVTHPQLTTLPPARARAEIFDGKKMLEDRFGIAVRHFCYPYGDCNQRVRDWVGEAGYEAAATIETGVNGPGHDPLLLRRFFAHSQGGPKAIVGKLARAWRRRATS